MRVVILSCAYTYINPTDDTNMLTWICVACTKWPAEKGWLKNECAAQLSRQISRGMDATKDRETNDTYKEMQLDTKGH